MKPSKPNLSQRLFDIRERFSEDIISIIQTNKRTHKILQILSKSSKDFDDEVGEGNTPRLKDIKIKNYRGYLG